MRTICCSTFGTSRTAQRDRQRAAIAVRGKQRGNDEKRYDDDVLRYGRALVRRRPCHRAGNIEVLSEFATVSPDAALKIKQWLMGMQSVLNKFPAAVHVLHVAETICQKNVGGSSCQGFSGLLKQLSMNLQLQCTFATCCRDGLSTECWG